jgi:hypothetical protein
LFVRTHVHVFVQYPVEIYANAYLVHNDNALKKRRYRGGLHRTCHGRPTGREAARSRAADRVCRVRVVPSKMGFDKK